MNSSFTITAGGTTTVHRKKLLILGSNGEGFLVLKIEKFRTPKRLELKDADSKTLSSVEDGESMLIPVPGGFIIATFDHGT